jgi:hypothetical protein
MATPWIHNNANNNDTTMIAFIVYTHNSDNDNEHYKNNYNIDDHNKQKILITMILIVINKLTSLLIQRM